MTPQFWIGVGVGIFIGANVGAFIMALIAGGDKEYKINDQP